MTKDTGKGLHKNPLLKDAARCQYQKKNHEKSKLFE